MSAASLAALAAMYTRDGMMSSWQAGVMTGYNGMAGMRWRSVLRALRRIYAVVIFLGVIGLGLMGLTGCSVTSPTTPARAVDAGATASAFQGRLAVTSGPQARFVRDVVTARGVTANDAPINPTNHFAVGVPVFLICVAQGVKPGTSHRLTIRWYLQGQPARMDGAYTYATVTSDGPLSFSAIYPAAGAGEARLYWDEPVADNSDRPNETFLAATIMFTIQ